jgi:selenocysteine lyase/cysteine desulfurase
MAISEISRYSDGDPTPQREGDILEHHFQSFADKVVGHNATFNTPYGTQPLVYFDWTASGRNYQPIEDGLGEIAKFIGNTHTGTTETGKRMTDLYHESGHIIKTHVNAGENDALVMTGSGSTGAINRFQRILGLKFQDQYEKFTAFAEKNGAAIEQPIWPIPEDIRPVVFVTHMEHHSDQTSYENSFADVVIIEPNAEGNVDQEDLRNKLEEYKDRKIKIGAFTAASNVTGIKTPIRELAKIMHEHDGLIFADYAGGAPYLPIDMHPENPDEKLDALYFSPHKFLGGPGTPGVLIFDKALYPEGTPPSDVGGGVVDWTNRWGEQGFTPDIETREDAGTPGFMQTIKAALAIKLKEEMGVESMAVREDYLVNKFMDGLEEIEGMSILAGENRDRLGIVSFHMEDLDLRYNLVVKLLNDKFGIQTRGGCSCAGTYGHCLLHIDREQSKRITDMIDAGDNSKKPGWIRASLHPTNSDQEVNLLLAAIKDIAVHGHEWKKDYRYDNDSNEWLHKSEVPGERKERAKQTIADIVATF